MNIALLIGLGFVAGTVSGLIGIGGGMILIPAMVYLLKFTQQEAQGTTLALMVPPIGLLAAYTYYKHGMVNISTALFICLGFFIGGLLGAKIAVGLPNILLKKLFGTAMLAVSLQMIFGK